MGGGDSGYGSGLLGATTSNNIPPFRLKLLRLGEFLGLLCNQKAGKFIVFALQSKQAVMDIDISDKQTHIGASGCNVINHHQVSSGKGMLAQIAESYGSTNSCQ